MFGGSERSYYFFVIVSLLYLLFRYGRRKIIYLFVILLFYDGLFAYLGSQVWNGYKALMPVFLMICLFVYRPVQFNFKGSVFIIISFLVFSFSFFLSSFSAGDNLTLILSQYAKYFILFFSFFLFFRLSYSYPGLFLNGLKKVLMEIILIQGLLNIVKFYYLGVYESIIGSISYTGGAAGTVLPIIGFIFIWIVKEGNLGNKDWIVVFLLAAIGFVSMKRAIWFILPFIMFMFFYYVPRRKITTRFILAIPLIVAIFYLGIRLNPTLNPQQTYWGDFNLGYAINYAQDYTFGEEENAENDEGRGGATLQLFTKIANGDISTNDVIGIGLKSFFATDSETFNASDYGITNKGSATGFFQTYLSTGFLGIISIVMFIFSILSFIQNKRLRFVILLFIFWEYFLYTGILIRTQAMSLLLIYSIFYANMVFHKNNEVSDISDIRIPYQ